MCELQWQLDDGFCSRVMSAVLKGMPMSQSVKIWLVVG